MKRNNQLFWFLEMVETDNFIIVYVLFCNLVAEIVQPVEWNTAFSKSNYFFTD